MAMIDCTMRNASGRVARTMYPTKQATGKPTRHRDPEHAAAGTLTKRGDRRGHDGDAGGDAEFDDVLGIGHGSVTPPR